MSARQAASEPPAAARALAVARARFPLLARVPGGSFHQGSECGRPDEAPLRLVRLPAFELGLTPVTVRQYRLYLRESGAREPPTWREPAFGAPELPATGLDWFEACDYARWLGVRLGGLWRLPCEAEWERAARGGLEQAPTPWGALVPPGECPEGTLSGPWPVARGTPNAFGLFDMGTIVHEWCENWYDGPVRAQGPPRRASRGGSWRHRVRFSPPSARSSLPPELRYADYGFRVLRATEPSA